MEKRTTQQLGYHIGDVLTWADFTESPQFAVIYKLTARTAVADKLESVKTEMLEIQNDGTYRYAHGIMPCAERTGKQLKLKLDDSNQLVLKDNGPVSKWNGQPVSLGQYESMHPHQW